MVDTDIIIIGGGAAGLMAACAAGEINTGYNTGYAGHTGNRYPKLGIVLLEKNTRVGRKLLSTGNGRCNLSNVDMGTPYYHSRSMQSVEAVLAACPADETLAFFKKLGLHTTLEGGRIYPYSQSSSAVLDVLRIGAHRYGVKTITGVTVRSVSFNRTTNRFIVKTSVTDENAHHAECHAECYTAQKLIVATGGKAAPSTGSDGTGYALLTRFGHALDAPYPVLTPLIVKHPALPLLKGIRVKPCRLTLARSLAEATGELLFTEYGLSGIPAMQVSGAVHLQQHVTVSLDLLPDMTMREVLDDLRQRRTYLDLAQASAENLFTGIFHKRVGQALLKQAGVINTVAGTAESMVISDQQLTTLARLTKAWIFDITGVKGFTSAQATGGGVDLADFSPSTLQSLLQPGLYAAGEVLNVYGDCGGYNLHWAWTTALLAGRAAAKALADNVAAVDVTMRSASPYRGITDD